MKNIRKFLTVFMILIGFIVTFAEGEHVHDEECGCDILDARDLTVDTSLQLNLPTKMDVLNPEVYEKLKELEENLNLLYEIAESRVSYEEFEELSDIVKSLSNQISAIEERTNSYIELLIESLRGELLTDISDIADELTKRVDELMVTIDIHDGDIQKIFETLGYIPELQQLVKSIEEESIQSILKSQEDMEKQLQNLKVIFEIHDSDILKIYETLGTLSKEVTALTELSERIVYSEEVKAQLEELALRLNLHDQDVVNIYDILASKADISLVQQLENRINEISEGLKSELVGGFNVRLELLEEYTNMIYEVTTTKVSAEEVEEMISPLKDELTDVSKRLSEIVEKTKVQDVDIIKLYDAVIKLAEELRRIGGRLSTLESLVNELRNK